MEKELATQNLSLQKVDSLSKALDARLLSLRIQLDKLDIQTAQQEDFSKLQLEVTKTLSEEKEKRKKIKRNLLTLENYTERYIPLVVLGTVFDMFKDVFRGEKLQKLRKVKDDLHVNLSLAITEDQGKGSIFANIIKINESL